MATRVTSAARLTVGTRGSPLALKQTALALEHLRQQNPHVDFVVRSVHTEGDLRPDVPMEQMDRGVFARELESALLAGEIDIAVHSFKDLPTDLRSGCTIAAISQREDPRDVLASPDRRTLRQLAPGSRLGTSSPRRLAQIRAVRPDLDIQPIRGNVGTRIAKVQQGLFDTVVLAAAGIKRLGLESHIAEYLEPEVCIPAAGQGALALEVRTDDPSANQVAAAANHRESYIAVTAEQAVLQRLGGGCRTPIAAYAQLEGDTLKIAGMVASADGARIVRASLSCPAANPANGGVRLAERLLDLGAGPLLEGKGQ